MSPSAFLTGMAEAISAGLGTAAENVVGGAVNISLVETLKKGLIESVKKNTLEVAMDELVRAIDYGASKVRNNVQNKIKESSDDFDENELSLADTIERRSDFIPF